VKGVAIFQYMGNLLSPAQDISSGDSLHLWNVTVGKAHKLSWTAERGWSSNMDVRAQGLQFVTTKKKKTVCDQDPKIGHSFWSNTYSILGVINH